jgi:uncharacterized protein YcfJ
MDKSMIKGIAIGGIAMVVAAAGGVTGYKAMNQPEFADVLAVKEVKETIRTPREECHDVQVQHRAPVKDPNRVAGTAVGGLVGGLLGSAVGGGNGKTAAILAGAAGGAYGGNQVQKNMQEKDVVTATEKRCTTVTEASEKLVGYDVSYRMEGKQGMVRMSFNPGSRIPVKDGQLVLTPPQTESKPGSRA